LKKDLQSLAGGFHANLSDLFNADPNRAQTFVAEGAGIRLDYSKQWLTADIQAALIEALKAKRFAAKRAELQHGGRINHTEHRAALHMALRALPDADYCLDGESVMPEVIAVRERCYQFANAVRDGTIRGATGQPFTDVLNIGIGGSDLGPMMVAEALRPFIDGAKPHYASNIDGAHLADILQGLNPETTLCLVASKTFTTHETLHNAYKVRDWMTETLGEQAIAAHFAALSVNLDEVRAFGISEDRMFPFWDWVGGRYSVWSSIGLSLMIAMGPDAFDAFLDGARRMDQHFLEAPLDRNIPVVMALLGVWYRNGYGHETQAVVPYAQRLVHFPTYLQALEMESNGKSVGRDGQPVTLHTSPVIWGQPGTNGQHAFFQLLHQGTLISPIDFIVTANPNDTDEASHRLLVANCLAQAEALAFGQTEADAGSESKPSGMPEENVHLAAHRSFPGNRPSSLIMMESLDPKHLGALMAAYEHKVFTQGVFWGINSFDQWGVELGKLRAKSLSPMLESGSIEGFSQSTQEAVKWLFRNHD
jgi:glucose-6-phosphate isomerase